MQALGYFEPRPWHRHNPAWPENIAKDAEMRQPLRADAPK